MGWIYLLTDDISDKCYIGKTCIGLKERLSTHFSDARKKKRNSYKDNWIRSVWAKGGTISIKEITEVPDEILDQTEILHIRLGRQVGLNLTNYSYGGDGFKRGNQYGKTSKAHIPSNKILVECYACKKEVLKTLADTKRMKHNYCSRSCFHSVQNAINNKNKSKKSLRFRSPEVGGDRK